MLRTAKTCGLIAVAALSCLAVAGPRIQTERKYLFSQSSTTGGLAPCLVMKNPGRDISGQIVAVTQERKTIIPFSLAAGTTQKFELPITPGFLSQLSLETNEGTIPVSNEFDQGGQLDLANVAVNDDKGAYRFLDNRKGAETRAVALDADPTAMPSQIAAYDRVKLVVLGHGAARMNDDSLRMLKLAALNGRTLVFIGGPGAPWWQDPRWKDILPASSAVSPIQVDGGKVVSGAVNQTASILALTPMADASAVVSEGLTIAVTRAFGHGRVIVTAFDPTAAPFQTSDGRAEVFETFSTGAFVPKATEPRPTPGRRRRRFTSVSTPTPNNSAFQVTLPQAGDVSVILVVYGILVAPINLFLLRKLGKPEWAWFTVPVLAAGAAGLILVKSRSLYNSVAENSVKAEVVLTKGQPFGIASGTSDVFFPNAGGHPVPSQNLLEISTASEFAMFGGTEPVTVLDDGRTKQALVNTSNLAFRSFTFRQAVPANSLLDAERVSANEVSVINLAAKPFKNIKVNGQLVGELAPGERKVFPVEGRPASEPVTDLTAVVPFPNAQREDADVIDAMLDDAPIGVMLGTRKVAAQAVHVSFVLPRGGEVR